MAGLVAKLIDRWKAKSGDFIYSDSKAGYSETYDYTDIPDNAWITKFMLIAALGTATSQVQLPFTSTDSGIINWQTDIPPGFGQTYAALLGNMFPKPVVYFLSSGTTYIDSGVVPTITFDGTLINTVVFDLQGQTGFIRF